MFFNSVFLFSCYLFIYLCLLLLLLICLLHLFFQNISMNNYVTEAARFNDSTAMLVTCGKSRL